LRAAAEWLERDAPHHDRFLLFLDEFDPHEPFDTPEPYASMYDPDWEGAHLIWPRYTRGAVANGVITEREGRQVRASYGGKLTMIDTWLGRVLDVLDRDDRWSDTAVILCTDHGHFLGEKDIWGKPAVPVYEPLGHIPLLIAWPGIAPTSIDALTTSVDLFATLVDLYGVTTVAHRTHGHSLVPLLRGETNSVRGHALSGVWGREVHLISDSHKYVRAPDGDNAPLSMWSNRWSTMPIHGHADLRLPPPDDRAVLDHMPGSSIPVIRQPFAVGDPLPFWAYARFDGNHLFDLVDDHDEERDLVGGRAEAAAVDELRAALEELEAPDDQLTRLGLGP
jgi:arylsulfatase A-like enzyme